MNISIYKVILNSFLFLGIFFYILLVDHSGSVSTLWYLLIFMLFLYLNVYIHEFGHAITGTLLGFQIKRLIIGAGRELMRFRIGQAVMIINWSLSGGVTHWGKVPNNKLKPRFGLLILGGILAQALAVLICWTILQVSIQELVTFSNVSYPHMFIYSNVLLMGVNLLPWKFNYMGIKLPTDGLQLLKLPFWKENDIQNILSAGKIMDGYEQYEGKNYPEAERLFRECMVAYPDTILPKINVAAALIKQGKVKDCIELLEEDIQSYRKDQLLFFLYNNLAWAYLISYTKADLCKADQYSSQAYLLNSKHRNVLGTRACVLIEQGNVADGLILLMKVVNFAAPVDDKLNDPVGFIYLAYGYYLQNNHSKVRRCIEKLEKYSQALDPDFRIAYQHVAKNTNLFEQSSLSSELNIATSVQME
jgi:tetratricopeptide (TPR) repeat protein